MRNEAYIHAVDNMAKLLSEAQKVGMLTGPDIATLQFNVFLLKMMPAYTGMERKTSD